MTSNQSTGMGAMDGNGRIATRRDYHALVRLRAEWVHEFCRTHPPDRCWCPALCRIPDIEDERELLEHVRGADDRWAAVLGSSQGLAGYLLCRVDEDEKHLRIEGQTPRVLRKDQFHQVGGELVDFAVRQAVRSGLMKVKMVYHGFPQEIGLLRALYGARGFAGECLLEMLCRNLRIDPGPRALQFRSAAEIPDAFYEAEAACGYCSSAQQAKQDCEFSVKMWGDVDPGRDWLAAYEGPDLVGTVRVAVSREGMGVLDGIAVAPDRRGRGVGRALLTRGLAALAGRTDVVWLDVHHDNPAAIRLYERAGFRTHHLHGDMIKHWTGEEST